MNACVALAKDWRTDKYLRRLEVRVVLEVDALSPQRTFTAGCPHLSDVLIFVGVGFATRHGSLMFLAW